MIRKNGQGQLILPQIPLHLFIRENYGSFTQLAPKMQEAALIECIDRGATPIEIYHYGFQDGIASQYSSPLKINE
jgi:hypothetical protein